MFPGMNQRKMQQAMKKMGVSQVDIPAKEVIIKCEEKDIIITNPSVAKVNMMGQETFQISGNIEETSSSPDISEEDIETVISQTGATKEKAEFAIKEAEGDLAIAILALKESKD